MKRIFIKRISTASLVAACLVARASAQVYSQSCGSFFNQTMSSEASTIWQMGPFAVGESYYWPRANGYVQMDGRVAGEPVQRSTYFVFGETSVSVPLSPQHMAIIGATMLLAFGTLLTGLIAKKCFKSTAR